jgi:hypothetical protein
MTPNLRRPDYNTPTQLQQHGVAANLGTCMLERGWQSYKDRESKKYLLRVAWVLPASKAIPRPGDEAKVTDGGSQLLFGNMLGQDRSTTNRDLALFCGEEALIAQFFHKWRPGIGCVNRYSVRKKGDEPETTKKTVLLAHDPDKLAARYGEELFDAAIKGLSGAGRVALWTFDENIPLPVRCVCRKGQMKFNFSSNCMKCGGKGYTLDPERKMGPNARIVLIVLQLKGITGIPQEDGSYSSPCLDITCAEIGALCGMSENTVSKALDEWEDLKVLQIVPGKVTWDRAGAVVHRDPQRIIWLPGMLLDQDMIDREKARFAAHLADTRERARLNGWAMAGVHLDRIAALHSELLRRWYMSRHSLGAFWNAMRKLIWVEKLPCGRAKSGHRDSGGNPDYRSYLFPIHLRE